MASVKETLSLWKRADTFDHSLPLRDTLTRVVKDIFSKYDNVFRAEAMSFARPDTALSTCPLDSVKEDTVKSMEQGSVTYEHGSEKKQEFHDISMSSEYSLDDLPRNPLRVIRFGNSDSEESMSIACSDQGNDHDYYYDHDHDNDEDTPGAGQIHVPSWRVTKWTSGDLDREKPHGGGRGVRSTGSKRRCMRCEAYDSHCKAAAENYRRTLASYTKTVSELMIGFKKVLERYPELRVDSSDDHLHYMVQAALGRNNLVQEMVRLAAKRQAIDVVKTESGLEDGKCNSDIVAVHEALNACYTDSETLRMILQRYTNLYVRYIEVRREMCSKVSKDITVMEFINLTQDRPGLIHGEPWSEAKAYVARMLPKVGHITPRVVGEACARALKNIDYNLSKAPRDFDKRKGLVDASIQDIRSRLDNSSAAWSWDSCMTDLHFDIRSDLTVLEDLVGVGEISVKTLLYERSMLVSQVRKMTRNQGSLELQVGQMQSELRDSLSRCRYAEMKALQ